MAVNQKNLVYNHDFRYFSNADMSTSPPDYGVPDGYQYEDSGGSGEIGLADEQLVITTSNDDGKMVFKQALHEFPRWQQVLRNQTVTACIPLDVSAGSQVSAILSDGISAASEVRISETANEMVIELQLFIDAKAKAVTWYTRCRYGFSGWLPTACSTYNHLPSVAVGQIGFIFNDMW